ncbi:Endonuclease/exonuclease/phosphatase [Catenulispora acidiphila DSM 44928]|uniref:Endonuclease/exonuclease/phosphatase n=1 Tax=Catenulispora acidiphila (strain DSM 44928 / JCM 14897 / NBRC 102108 / NRRL B-24433 / ID139908) TaxID=479433 RepID=C7Q5C9_CATAD|nr:RNA repair domain-containing protein [Catenulispora acidiphila]ACU75898.1 Endonuclease/exonuclease/phosphatase [Catenulispora acidiphila DSM 44928]
MRTSQEIYHRVRWDARFDASRFVLGVEMRGREPKRVPLPSFDPHGDIPWHRVLFFEADGRLVWDRASGLDALDALDASGAGLAQRVRLLAAPFFEPRTPHAFIDGRWQPGTNASSPAIGLDLRILTWNTLWDRYDKDLIRTAERRPMLLAALRAADVDVIALQEAEPALVKMLLAEDWVRREWTLGGDPRSSDVADSGVLVLSRLPVVEAGWHALGRYKAVAAVVVEGGAGPVVVANTHLSSDHSADGASLRTEQLGQLADGLRAIDAVPVVLVGDFNDDTDAPASRLGMTDAWTQVHGVADDTATFDPSANPLAAVSSLTGDAKRLDRVLLLGATASDVRLIGEVPNADGLFVSDHYGITALVTATASATPTSPIASATASPALDATPTARTALAWIPPTPAWEPIQEIRRRLDPQVHRWPPHVNLLFGFIPESEFDAAIPLLSKAAATVAPFETELTEVRHFTHRTDSTLWLHPTGTAWQTLHTALLEAFPTCRNRETYTPHLTIAKVPNPPRTPPKIAPTTTPVTELALLSRRADGPMEVRAVIELGTGAVRLLDVDPGATSATPQPAAPGSSGAGTGTGAAISPNAPAASDPPHLDHPAATSHRALSTGAVRSMAADAGAASDSAHLDRPAATGHRALSTGAARSMAADADAASDSAHLDRPAATLTARITEALPEATIHLVGSRRTATHLPAADIDLVAAVPGAPDIGALERRVAKALGAGHRVRQLVAARVPGLRIVTPRLSADLVLAPTGDIPPADAVARRAELGETIASSLSAVSDAEALIALRPGPHVRVAKAWARARGLDAAPLGGLPGLAWALMAARCRDLTDFFETWAAHSWQDPIPTPTAPIRDLTLHLTASMRDLITEELYNGWETVTSTPDPLPTLLAPPPMHRRHRRWAVITLRADGIEARDVLEGRVRGRTRSLLSALDEAGVTDTHAWPRAFHTADANANANTELRTAIGLGRTPPTRDALAEITKPWLRGLSGVTVELAGNGDVPTLI